MTEHYEKICAKFAEDLGVIKTKIVSFSKKLFSIALPGVSLFSEHDLE